MKFYIEVKHPTMGSLISETFEATPEKFEKVKQAALTHQGDMKMDFFDQDGDYVIIKEGIVLNSLVYFKVIKGS